MNKYPSLLLLSLCLFHSNAFADPFTLESAAFKLNAMIPVQYTCNGADTSPPLLWHNAPPKTKSFALLVDDRDAPNGTWSHWIIFNIPPNVTNLDAGSSVPAGAASGKNSWGGLGYRGPCPPVGAHTYVFKLYALDNVLNLAAGADHDTVQQMITSHVIGTAELVGLYQK